MIDSRWLRDVTERERDTSETATRHERDVLTIHKPKAINNLSPFGNEVGNEKSLFPTTDAPFLMTRRKRKLSGQRLETFLRFWSAFDYKTGKAEAADAWLDIPSLTDKLVEVIVSAATREARARGDLRAAGKTPKMAQGWLSGRRWEDETLPTAVDPADPASPYVSPKIAMLTSVPPDRVAAIRRTLEANGC